MERLVQAETAQHNVLSVDTMGAEMSDLDARIAEQERELFGEDMVSVGESSTNPLFRFLGENLAKKALGVTTATTLIMAACGGDKNDISVEPVTRNPAETVVIVDESDTPTPGTENTPDNQSNGKGDGPTNTPERPTLTPTAEVTEEPKPPVYERENYPYDLAEVKEYQGPEVKFVFGIEQDTYDRPEDNICKLIGDNNTKTETCGPIRRFELNDEYLRQYAPEEFPNGMNEEEMIQRFNDFVLKGFVWNLQQKGMYKDLTVNGLKDMIHEKKAPEFVQTFANGDSIKWDLNNLEIHFVLTDKTTHGQPGTKIVSLSDTVKYHKVDEAGVIGLWSVNSLNQDMDSDSDPEWHRHSFEQAHVILNSLAMMSYDKHPGGDIGPSFITDNILAFRDVANRNVASIIVVSR